MKQLDDFCKWCKDGRLQGAEFVLDCFLPNFPSAELPLAEIKQEFGLADAVQGEWIWRTDILYLFKLWKRLLARECA